MGYLPPMEQTPGSFEYPGNQSWKSPIPFSRIWDPKFEALLQILVIAQEGRIYITPGTQQNREVIPPLEFYPVTWPIPCALSQREPGP